MSEVKVDEIFASAFASVTKKLVAVDLQRKNAPVFQGEKTYKESVYTKGALDAHIICEFSTDMFETIVLTMYGGDLPPENEIPLYVNEYVNIVCGRAISDFNNQTKTKTRLSIPSFYSLGESVREERGKEQKIQLFYETESGRLQVSIDYTVEISGE